MSQAQVYDPVKNKPLVEISERAAEEIQRQLTKQNEAGQGIRLAVKGGGCSGFSYHLDYDQPTDRDHVLDIKGVRVLIDRKSAIYLKGMTLDFSDSLNSRGFKFVNPNASNTCGCGESFSV